MKLQEILKQRYFKTWEGICLEVFSSYKVKNHETKRCESVIHCESADRTFRIPLKEFKKALKIEDIFAN